MYAERPQAAGLLHTFSKVFLYVFSERGEEPMLKLMIVDDEYLIRQYIRNCIDWKKLGYRIVGEFESAASALRAAKETRPDVVLTDICMPEIDGLSFTEKIKECLPDVKVIVVTGHDDFAYAQRGIQVGLDNYLLKPVNEEELKAVALETKERILADKKQNLLFQELADYRKENETIVREYYLRKLLEMDAEEEILNSPIIHQWIPGNWDFFQAAVLGFDDFSQILAGNHIKKGDSEWLERYLQLHAGKRFVWVPDKFGHMVLICLCSDFMWEPFLEQLEVEWMDTFHFSIAYGIGMEQYSIEDIHESYLLANNRLNCAIAFGDNRYRNNREGQQAERRVRPIAFTDLKKLQQYIETDSPAQMLSLVDKWFEGWKHTNLMDLSYLRLQLLNAVFYLYLMNHGSTENFQEEYNQHYQKVFQTPTLHFLQEYFVEICKKMMKRCGENSSARPSRLIYTIKQYMEEHISEPELSLASAAKVFYLNSSYLSRIFKKETGRSFVEYLTDLRIEKAKLLLKNSDLKIYEIAERVGIDNPNYFGILFKKVEGCSPLEYRGR